MTRVLIAARGYVAIRGIAACRRRGLSPIAVAAAADPNTRHTTYADNWLPLPGREPADTYENVAAIVAAARQCAADLVYPGNGALAEDPSLVSHLSCVGIGTVGPTAAALGVVRDKAKTVAIAHQLGVPTLPHATTTEGLEQLTSRVGTPIVIKPNAGCLGKGQQVVRHSSRLLRALTPYTDQEGWYAEQYVDDATVVAVTISVDVHRSVCHLGERETLLARDGRKLLDASPVLTIPAELVSCMRRDTRAIAREAGVIGVITCEFIVDAEATGYFFLEMNPRLSGGFRMCEAQSGLDLLDVQMAIAQGEGLKGRPSIDTTVHCLEARWYLLPGESCEMSFRRWRLPEFPHGTVDCTVREACSLSFDTLLAQLFAIGSTRGVAAARLIRATENAEYVGGPRHYGRKIATWLAVAQGDDVALVAQ